MVFSSCFVPNCKSGSATSRKANKLAGIKECSLFQPPKDPDCLAKWRRAIPRKDRDLGPKDGVCELHFQEEFIERFFITHMPDGTDHKLKRAKPRLKPEAVPTIFPNLPKYLTTVKKVRKPPTERPFVAAAKKQRTLHQEEKLSTLSPSRNGGIKEMDNSELLDLPSWLKDMSIVKVPSSSWSTSIVGSVNGIWTCYNKDFTISKRVVVSKDLPVKIFCVEKEVNITGIARPESAEDVSAILKRVDSLPICAGVIENIRSELCTGYLESQESKSSRGKCSYCKMSLRHRFRADKAEVRIHVLHARSQSERKRADRLKRKVIKMKARIQAIRKQCSRAKQERIDEHIKDLPENQQLAIKACLHTAQVKSSNRTRYTMEWLYKCNIIWGKSHETYEYLRKHHILALPSVSTLRKHLKNIADDFDLLEENVISNTVCETIILMQ